MNKTKDEVFGFLDFFKKINTNNEVVLCVPFVYIPLISPQIRNIKIGAQNCYFKNEGSFTGEISPKMLSSLNVKYVIIGHSERKKHFNETDKETNLKILLALKNSLNIIVCIENFSLVKKYFSNVDKKYLNKISIAYEPTNAIGNGNAQNPEKVEIICDKIRGEISKIYGKNNSLKVKILYGGSVNFSNSKDFLKQKNINGILVGKASLNVREFLLICESTI